MLRAKQLIKRYGELAYSKPLTFNIINGVFLFGVGDFLQQKIDFNKTVLGKKSKNTENKDYNYYQTFKIIVYSIIGTPINHYFYTKFLPKIAPLSDNPTTKEMVRKVFLDYIILSPIFSSMFPLTMGVLDGLESEELIEKVKTDTPVLMTADIAFWPLFQFFNFRFVPIFYQTTAIYTASLFWTIIMSAIESRDTGNDNKNG